MKLNYSNLEEEDFRAKSRALNLHNDVLGLRSKKVKKRKLVKEPLEEFRELEIFYGKESKGILKMEMEMAKKNIKILLPSLLLEDIKDFNKYAKRGINVEIITNDFEFNQEKLLNEIYSARYKEEKGKSDGFSKFFLFISILSVLILTLDFFEIMKLSKNLFFANSFVTILSFISIFIFSERKNSYLIGIDSLVNLKLLKNMSDSEEVKTFINSKIYLIDEKILYVSSGGFLQTKELFNYETTIRVTDEKELEKALFQFKELNNQENYPYYSDWDIAYRISNL